MTASNFPLSRRQFHAGLASLLSLHALSMGVSRRSFEGYFLLPIDGSVDGILNQMAERGWTQAAVLTRTSPAGDHPWQTPEWTQRRIESHRDRLTAFTAPPPEVFDRADEREMHDWLSGRIAGGFAGVGWHQPTIAIDDPRNLCLAAACRSLYIPLVMRSDLMRNHDSPDRRGMNRMLGLFPSLNLVGLEPV